MTIRKSLTRNIGPLFDDIRDELVLSFDSSVQAKIKGTLQHASIERRP